MMAGDGKYSLQKVKEELKSIMINQQKYRKYPRISRLSCIGRSGYLTQKRWKNCVQDAS